MVWQDSNGRILQDEPVAREPLAPGQNTEKEIERYGVPVYGRIQIPLRSQYRLRWYADYLRQLANSLDLIARDTGRDEWAALWQAWGEIQNTNRRCSPRKQTDQAGQKDTPSGGGKVD